MWFQRGLIAFIVVLILATSVCSLGIAPARKTITFEPNLEQTLSYRVYNSDRQALTARIQVGDALSDYATPYPNQLEFTETDQLKSFEITLKLPETLDHDLQGEILVIGTPESGSPSSVSATLTLKTKLNVKASAATGGAVISTGDSEDAADVSEPPEEDKEDEGKKQESDTALDLSNSNTFIYGAVLLIILIGNVVFFILKAKTSAKSESKPSQEDINNNYFVKQNIRSVTELIASLKAMDEATASVIIQSKCIYGWIFYVLKNPIIADKVHDVENKQEIINTLESYLSSRQTPQQNPDSVQQTNQQL